MRIDPTGAIWGFNAICNTYFALGLIEAILTIIGLKKQQ